MNVKEDRAPVCILSGQHWCGGAGPSGLDVHFPEKAVVAIIGEEWALHGIFREYYVPFEA